MFAESLTRSASPFVDRPSKRPSSGFEVAMRPWDSTVCVTGRLDEARELPELDVMTVAAQR